MAKRRSGGDSKIAPDEASAPLVLLNTIEPQPLRFEKKTRGFPLNGEK
jgi:hypothetical protein